MSHFSVCSITVFYLWLLSLNFSVKGHLKCCTSYELNPVAECVIFREKTSIWLTVTKNRITPTQRSGSLAKSPEELLLRCLSRLRMHLCFLVLAKVCSKVFIKKEVVCLFFAFINNIFFSTIQPFNSVNMTLSVGKTDMWLIS